jgi:DNA repair protein RadC
MANQPLWKFLEIKGLGMVKIIRLEAAFEIARRITLYILKELGYEV